MSCTGAAYFIVPACARTASACPETGPGSASRTPAAAAAGGGLRVPGRLPLTPLHAPSLRHQLRAAIASPEEWLSDPGRDV